MKNSKRIILWATVVTYFIIVISYYIGKTAAGNAELEFRFWVDVLFRIIVWFVPVILIGIVCFLSCVKQWKKRSRARWIVIIITQNLLGFSLGETFLLMRNAWRIVYPKYMM